LIDHNFLVVTCPTEVLRFMACRVKVSHIFERLVNNFGNEVIPDFFNINNETRLKKLTLNEVDFKWPNGLRANESINETHPNTEGVVELWGDMDLCKNFSKGDPIFVQTTGSFFIKTMQINNNGEGKFKGEDAQMMSQISSLMSMAPRKLAEETGEGVPEEDWDNY